MADPLSNARALVDEVYKQTIQAGVNLSATDSIALAQAYAAIAQAEQLKRIADNLARITGDSYLRTYEMNKSP